MKKETILLVGVTLVIGILIGILFSRIGDKAPRTASAPSAPPPGAAVNFQQNIQTLEEIVARDPKNRNAWVQLGHNYFDSNQPMKAIEAYTNALELNGNDPDVLTDQGIMFRRVGWFDRAIENFQKALEVNGSHLQALFNLGVVYRYDLQDFAKAKDVWSRYLQLNPSGPGSDRIRQEMSLLQANPQMPPAPAGQ